MSEKTTRLVFVRHLDTRNRQNRQRLKEDADNQRLLTFFDNTTLTSEQLKEVKDIGELLIRRYGYLPPDSQLPILPGQEAIGHELGKRLVGRFGFPDRWEVSPYRRTRQTSKLLREGIQEARTAQKLPKEIVDRSLRERNFGASATYPSSRIYLVTHPKELVKYLKTREHYAYPHGGESRKSLSRRIEMRVRRLKNKRKYEGKTTVTVAHSLVIEEHVKQLTGLQVDNDHIWTGSVTIFEASPKKWFQPRKYRLVGLVGERLV